MLDQLLSQPGFSVPILLVGLVMYFAWTAAYVLIIIHCARQKSYGVPLMCLCLNVVWEFYFSFNVLGSNLFWFFVWGNRLWFVFDVIIVWQCLKHGRERQVIPFLKRHFYVILAFCLVMAAIGLYTFSFYYDDLLGVSSSMTMNLGMSALFIFMLFGRWDDCNGLNYPAAWLKMIGTAAGSVFLYVWWPAQFEDGKLIGHPTISEPKTYSWMWFLYVGILIIDCVYIWQLGKRRRELGIKGWLK